MCGIAAIIQLAPVAGVMDRLKEMTALIRHRGPDDEGFALFSLADGRAEFLGGPDTPEACYGSPYPYAPVGDLPPVLGTAAEIGFGHRRLAILDLSPAGHQPMSSRDGRLVIIFNGEIYNYLELRQELEREGFTFLTQSDTEVILCAYAHWGTGFLARLNGMFAFLIYDRQAGRLIGARDRYGVKPLYYWYSPDRRYLAFASEIKQFTVLPGWTPTLNGRMAYDFLSYGLTDHTSETMFAQVRQLRGGECFSAPVQELHRGVPVERWYERPMGETRLPLTEAAEALQGHLIQAVDLRLRSDVPFGYSISGGLDSSTIVGFAAKLTLDARKASLCSHKAFFCACDESMELNEQDYAMEAARAADVEMLTAHTSLDELLDILDTMIWHMDEPFRTTSAYAEWNVYKLMADNRVIVSLNGHGGDELLGGYISFAYIYLANLLTRLHFKDFYKNYVSLITPYSQSLIYSLFKIMELYVPNTAIFYLRDLFQSKALFPKWINVKKLRTEHHCPDAIGSERNHNFKWVCENQLLTSSLPSQLHWADRSSMAHSHESRQPFLDYQIVDFVAQLPVAYLIGDGFTKRILRLAIKGVVPEKIRLRKTKLGFETPEEHWFKNQGTARLLGMIEDAVKDSDGMLTTDLIALAKHQLSGASRFSGLWWRIIAFDRWRKVFQVQYT